MGILKQLYQISEENLISFHMPGHKNGRLLSSYFSDILKCDITEIPGADNLHDPREAIKETQTQISDFYGSNKSYILVNGSTAGIYSAVMSVCNPFDKILISRESHRSVYSALLLGGIASEYVYPECDESSGVIKSVKLTDIQAIIEKDDAINAVLITSPNYYGVMSDIESISNYLHSKGKLLIVDEAHGAHLELSESLPSTAVRNGADIVIQSFHKTLPALTQSAAIHINSERVNRQRLEQLLAIHQTSSPSYLIMASIDAALDIAINQGEKLTYDLLLNITEFEKSIEKNLYIQRYKADKHVYDYDPCRIVLVNKGSNSINFNDLEEVLRKDYHIQIEYSFAGGMILIPSIANIENDFKALTKALNEIDFEKLINMAQYGTMEYVKAELELNIRDAFYGENEEVLLKNAFNRISSDFIIPYPPGVPIIVPGEMISHLVIERIMQMAKCNTKIIGINHHRIRVLKED